MRATFLPKTKLGKVSIRLGVAFFLLLGAGILITTVQGHRDNQTFFSNPLLSITMLSAILSAIACFITGITSIIKSREKSVLVYFSALVGLYILFMAIGEILFPH